MATLTVKLAPLEAPRLNALFVEHGFELRDANHAFWQARGPGCVATFYTSGKLVLQGTEADVWGGLIGVEVPSAVPFFDALRRHPQPPPEEWVGTDEAGKGDYFGPLVVAGVSLARERVPLLAELGVADSKKIADARIHELERAVLAMGDSEVMVLRPEKYNELYAKFRNLNRLLAWAHARVIESLLERRPADFVLVDQFTHDGTLERALGPLARARRFAAWTKAESDPAVAAASVLARAAFLRGLASLSRQYDVHLHPGAGAPTLASGHAFVARHGKDALGAVAKTHFLTTGKL